jgi:hypothetical protein
MSVTWQLRANNGFNNLYTMTAAQAVDYVAAFFGIFPLSATTRTALINARTAETNKWWAATNLLTMTMLAPEFHMA